MPELERPPRVRVDLVSADLDGDAARLAGLGGQPVRPAVPRRAARGVRRRAGVLDRGDRLATAASARPEFTHLVPPAGVPLHLLVQRLGRADDRVGAHLDLACDGSPSEVRRLGAVDVGPGPGWHTLRDPVVGLPFWVTSQQP